MSAAWNITVSPTAQRTRNPIRDIVDNMKAQPNKLKSVIPLGLGDPCAFGNLPAHPSTTAALLNVLTPGTSNGYVPAVGAFKTREAIAKAFTTPEAPLEPTDVVVTSGCSDALNITIGTLGGEGDNILLPAPGFGLYESLALSKGIECRFYDLLPDRNWEADLKHLESLIDGNTKALLVNNPSNPCGSVYTKTHLLELIEVAEKHRIPIISDEIYAEMVFKGETFYPMAGLTKTVPILTMGGIAKRYLVPGWRCGWILIHDRGDKFREVRKGLTSLAGVILGANSLVQTAVPDILNAPQEFYDKTLATLEEIALITHEKVMTIPGLKPVKPQGAMYMMIEVETEKFKDLTDDVVFAEKLFEEESVQVLPGKCFRCKTNFFRIVLVAPTEVMSEAVGRMRAFCARHQK